MNHLLKNCPSAIQSWLASVETPCFIFYLQRIAQNVRALQTTLGPDALYYAVKCNSLRPVLQAVKDAGGGFEVNNLAELDQVTSIGVEPRHVINSAPLTAAEDIRAMYSRGVRWFTVASFEQVQNLRINAPGCSVTIRIKVDNGGSEFNLSDRLGIEPDRVGSLITAIKEANLSPRALTFHVGSQCLKPDNWHASMGTCARLLDGQEDIHTINIGGGIPIRYHCDVPSLEEIASAIRRGIAAFSRKPRILIEPGRFIVGDSAMALTSVIGVDKRPEMIQAALDISVFSGLIEIVESRGDIQYPISVINHGDQREAMYTLIGPTCAGTDIINPRISLPKLKVNFLEARNSSRLIIGNTGAYTLDYIKSARRSGFNGAPSPRVFVIHESMQINECFI